MMEASKQSKQLQDAIVQFRKLRPAEASRIVELDKARRERQRICSQRPLSCSPA